MEAFAANDALVAAVFTAFAMLLYPTQNPLYIAALMGLLGMYAYWAHRALHCFKNPHSALHHGSPNTTAATFFGEVLTESSALYLLFLALPVYPKVYWFYGIYYSTMHAVNNTAWHLGNHAAHHANDKYNYGPDALDRLFGTSTPGIAPENMAHTYANILVAFAAVQLYSYYLGSRKS